MSKEAKVGYKKNIGTILLLSFAGSINYLWIAIFSIILL